MITICCKQPEELIDYSLEWLRKTIEVHKIKDIFLAAGASPTPLYQHLERNRPEFFNNTRLVQIDDIISGPKKDCFKNYFLQELPSYRQQFHFIEQGEIKAEAAILGIGLNGHVAFHEPHLPKEFSFGPVELSDESCQYLNIEPGTMGLSHGLGNFLKCKRILLIVTGKHKRAVVQRTLNGDRSLPAAHLLDHANLTVIGDQAALEG